MTNTPFYIPVDENTLKELSNIYPVSEPINAVARAEYDKANGRLKAILPDLLRRVRIACLPNVEVHQAAFWTDAKKVERAKFWKGEAGHFDRLAHMAQRGFLLEMISDELAGIIRSKATRLRLASKVAWEAEQAAIAGKAPESAILDQILGDSSQTG